MNDVESTSTAGYEIRKATNADAKVVRELIFAVLREHGLKPDPTGTDSDLDDIEGHYFARGGWFVVVENARREIVGSVALYPLDDGTCELRKMYLAPAARGRGLGGRILEHALSRAHDLGFARVTLETASVLEAAIALYVRYGFRPYAAAHLSARCNAAYVLDLSRRFMA